MNPSLEAWARHPWRLHPRNRPHPAFDNFPPLLVGVDLGRHVDPRHAWMLFKFNSKYSIPMEIHPRMA
ncbi:hypothetical protein DI041_15015 [Stenotrophomonas maltophilia]|nr:hypothetical protein DI034_13510 [Stenotrophomonas maltophilia]TIE57462.1 hypothetical protein DI041_15015 [Stenotrophomonas maltophilia]